MDFHNFFSIYVFDVKEYIADIPTEQSCSGDKSRSTSGSGVTDDSVLKILKFLHYSCFWGQGIHCWYSYWATLFGWPIKSRSTSGSRDTQIFHNIPTIHGFMVRESFADISTELPCSGDLENPEKLPVLEVFKVTHTT